MRQRILFIDDDELLIAALRRRLLVHADEWDMVFMTEPGAAVERVKVELFDAVVCDYHMPGLNGLEFLRVMRHEALDTTVPVTILTGSVDQGKKGAALDAGATDLLTKPVDFDELLARLRNMLRLKDYQDQIKRHTEELERAVAERSRELEYSRLEIILILANAAECRDNDTGNHVVRVAGFSQMIAAELGLSAEMQETIFLASALHDIGKLGIKSNKKD